MLKTWLNCRIDYMTSLRETQQTAPENTRHMYQFQRRTLVVMLMSCCDKTQIGGWIWSHSLFFVSCRKGIFFILLTYYTILCMICISFLWLTFFKLFCIFYILTLEKAKHVVLSMNNTLVHNVSENCWHLYCNVLCWRVCIFSLF